MFSLISCFSFSLDSFSCIILSNPLIKPHIVFSNTMVFMPVTFLHAVTTHSYPCPQFQQFSERLSHCHLGAHKHIHTCAQKLADFLWTSTQSSLEVPKTEHTVLREVINAGKKFLPLFPIPFGTSCCHVIARQIYISFSVICHLGWVKCSSMFLPQNEVFLMY